MPVLKKIIIFLVFCVLMAGFPPGDASGQQQRFPMPEFQSDYELPETERPEPRAPVMEYMDLTVLLAVMLFTTWLALKKRSRRGIFLTAIFALIYFGFYRDGCICAVGSIQNLSLSFFDGTYTLPLTVLAFFTLPLLLTLFAGRIFCASACPLGVIQDLVIIKPIRLAPWLRKSLGLIPFIYLGLAILYAATSTRFIICQYDPFVGIFRMGATFHMAVLGVMFLATGMFVARPYCRFLCPYGALLKVFSGFSAKHLSITPDNCIKCRLCEDACPFDAIDHPTEGKEHRPGRSDFRRFIIYAALTPLLIALGAWAVSGADHILARAHPDVRLASRLTANPELMQESDDVDIETFLASDRNLEMLVEDAGKVRRQFRTGGYYLGGFIGLLIGIGLMGQVVYRKREDYEANRGDCYSCGRCMNYCPVGKPDHPYHQEAEHHGSQHREGQPGD